MNTRYDVLGLKTDATPDEIKKAYRKLAAVTHPDRAGEVTASLFRTVQDAYETLSDPSRRSAYDREIGECRPEPQPYAENDFESEDYVSDTDTEPEDSEVQPSPREIRRRKIGKVAVITALTVLAGAWLFQEYQLWTLVQAKNQFRMYTAQGVPAIAYAVLWAWGTLVAAVADDVFHSAMLVLGSSAVAGAFAFITATGTPGQWFPALGTGLALTLVIAFAVRVSAARR